MAYVVTLRHGVSRRTQIDSPCGHCHKQPMEKPIATLSDSKIARRILSVRGLRVMLDRDLAILYGVSTKQLNQQVLRNRDRFPSDFMFQLTPEESDSLRLQSATSNRRWGGRRYLPYAFTEQGVAMLSGVLHSRRAVRVDVEIMRTFVKRRQILSSRDSNEDTTVSSGLSSTRSASSWPQNPLRVGRWDFVRRLAGSMRRRLRERRAIVQRGAHLVRERGDGERLHQVGLAEGETDAMVRHLGGAGP